MDHCPVELWLRFASLACTDGGKTGCSLSLVSRYVRDATKRFRYQSIAIISEQSLISFARLIQNTIPSPANIYHLFVSVTILTREVSRKRLDTMRELLMTTLIRLAPTIQTLVIHDAWRADGALAAVCERITFPVLRSLGLPFEMLLRPSIPRAFPALRRLHASSLLNVNGLSFWESIASSFPSITHLRMTGVSQDESLPPLLRVLLKVPVPASPPWDYDPRERVFGTGSKEEERAQDVAAALQHLKDVIVQPRLLDGDAWGGTGDVLHGWMIGGLDLIASDNERGTGDGRLFVLPDSKVYTLEEAKDDWLDLVIGGCGPWSVAEIQN